MHGSLHLLLVAIYSVCTAYQECALEELQFAGPLGGYNDAGKPRSHTSVSAVQNVVQGHNGEWILASVNSGLWKTSDLYSESPHWTSMLDGQPVNCTSMGGLAVASWNDLLMAAGCGYSTSSAMNWDWNSMNAGDLAGVMISQDGGSTWKMLDSFPPNYYISSVLMVYPSTIVATVRSNFFNASDGGIFVSSDMGGTWKQTFSRSVNHVVDDGKQLYISLVSTQAWNHGLNGDPATDTVYTSADKGLTWTVLSNGLSYGKMVPFHTQLTQSFGTVFLAVFTVDPNDPLSIDVGSGLYYLATDASQPKWTKVKGQPKNMEGDSMNKDRLTVLADPDLAKYVYICGNGEFLCYRVDWASGRWALLRSSDGFEPHADHRGMAWDADNENLIVTNDGGIFIYTEPRGTSALEEWSEDENDEYKQSPSSKKATNETSAMRSVVSLGKWFSPTGDLPIMEFIYAHYDSRLNRWFGGAQDNSVQLSQNGDVVGQALGYTDGDGVRTGVDNTHCPSRLFGSTYNMYSLTMCQGDKCFGIPFAGGDNYPYFVSAWALNSQDPDFFYVWRNATSRFQTNKIEYFKVPNKHQLFPISTSDALVSPDIKGILELVVGGYTNGVSNPNLMVAVNSSHLFITRTFQLDNEFEIKPLPSQFFEPVALTWGSCSHHNSMSLAVNPADSDRFVVTGWPAEINAGQEHIWYTNDGGDSWLDVMGDLAKVTPTIARVRPQGIQLIEMMDVGLEAFVVGTVNGVFVSWISSSGSDPLAGKWSRLGLLSDLPMVVVAGLSYEHYSDTLVVATMGRGIYLLHDLKTALLTNRDQQLKASCQVPAPSPVASSGRFFPPQETC